MKTITSVPAARADETASRVGRRGLVVGAGVAGASALAAAALHRGANEPTPVADAASKNDATPDEGYRLTEHVKRYYATTRS